MLVMCLRRSLPQGPTRRVLQFARPPFPQRQVAIGLSHDHMCWTIGYEHPNFDVLDSEENQLIDLVKQLQGYGCPFQLPFWVQI
eukprot:Skav209984  [mRNA]  locus=scaffold1046:300995:301246:+ [translate_table: standard]